MQTIFSILIANSSRELGIHMKKLFTFIIAYPCKSPFIAIYVLYLLELYSIVCVYLRTHMQLLSRKISPDTF